MRDRGQSESGAPWNPAVNLGVSFSAPTVRDFTGWVIPQIWCANTAGFAGQRYGKRLAE
jgi:hypothetical protein